jgi:cytosine/adenosine deaminase-related metal-dependent hydrolase
MFEEMRGLEMDERLATQQRGHWTAPELVEAATAHSTLGYPDAGAIAVGQRADLVTIDLASPRTAGTGSDECSAVFAATAADVVHVVADGRVVFERGDEERLGREVDEAVEALWS